MTVFPSQRSGSPVTHTSSQATFYCTLRYRGSTSNHFYGLLVPFAQNDGNIYGDISLFLRIQRQYGNLMSALFKLFRCPCGIETKRSQKHLLYLEGGGGYNTFCFVSSLSYVSTEYRRNNVCELSPCLSAFLIF